MSIAIGGLVSGLDTNSIVNQLMEVEKRPIIQLQQKEADYQLQLSTYGLLQNNLNSLQSAVKGLDGVSDFNQFSASSSDSDILTVSANNKAISGSYNVTVRQIAEVHKLSSAGFSQDEAVGEGTLHLKLGNNEAIDINISDTDTIEDVADAINETDSGVTATAIFDGSEYFLSLTGKETGKDNVIDLKVTDLDGNNKDSSGLSRLYYSETDNSIIGGTKQFGASEVVGYGDLLINVGGVDNTVSIATDSTISDVVDSINTAGIGVTAEAVDDGEGNFSLRVTADDGISDITMAVDDGDGEDTDESGLSRLSYYNGEALIANLNETQDAKDSIIKVDGIDNIKRSDNTIDDIWEGVTLTLKAAHENPDTESTSLSVTHNTSAISSRINSFVNAYNNTLDFFSANQSYDAETEEAGILLGDSTSNMIQRKLDNVINSSIPGISDSLKNITDLGITRDEDGRLEIDSSSLNNALNNDFDDVIKFFTQTTEGFEGIAVRMNNALEGITASQSGILTAREDGIRDSIEDIQEKVERLNERLITKEERLWSQFSALEVIISQYQSTGDFLSQQIAAFQNFNNFVANR